MAPLQKNYTETLYMEFHLVTIYMQIKNVKNEDYMLRNSPKILNNGRNSHFNTWIKLKIFSNIIFITCLFKIFKIHFDFNNLIMYWVV